MNNEYQREKHYKLLQRYLSQRTEATIKLSFDEIEKITGRMLLGGATASFSEDTLWNDYSPISGIWLKANYSIKSYDHKKGVVEFKRTAGVRAARLKDEAEDLRAYREQARTQNLNWLKSVLPGVIIIGLILIFLARCAYNSEEVHKENCRTGTPQSDFAKWMCED